MIVDFTVLEREFENINQKTGNTALWSIPIYEYVILKNNKNERKIYEGRRPIDTR